MFFFKLEVQISNHSCRPGFVSNLCLSCYIYYYTNTSQIAILSSIRNLTSNVIWICTLAIRKSYDRQMKSKPQQNCNFLTNYVACVYSPGITRVKLSICAANPSVLGNQEYTSVSLHWLYFELLACAVSSM